MVGTHTARTPHRRLAPSLLSRLVYRTSYPRHSCKSNEDTREISSCVLRSKHGRPAYTHYRVVSKSTGLASEFVALLRSSRSSHLLGTYKDQLRHRRGVLVSWYCDVALCSGNNIVYGKELVQCVGIRDVVGVAKRYPRRTEGARVRVLRARPGVRHVFRWLFESSRERTSPNPVWCLRGLAHVLFALLRARVCVSFTQSSPPSV